MTLRTRIIVFFAVIAVAVAFLLPTVARDSFTSGWISKPIALGLDLSGGVHLVYEVQTKEAVRSRLQGAGNGIRSELRAQKIAVTRTKVSDNFQLELTLLSDTKSEQAKQIITDNFRDLSFVGKSDDAGRPKLVYGMSEQQMARIESESVNQAIETLRNRVDQFGVSEPTIQRVGINRIMLQMPGVSDVEAVKRVVGSVAKLEFHLVPTGAARGDEIRVKDRSGAPVTLESEALMQGDAVAHAQVSVAQGQVEVILKLTTDGGRRFGQITSENVGRELGIVLDGVVYSSPVIKQAITGGTAQISGGFSLTEAKELAVVLRAGALPAPLTVVEERTVGPTLGRESIQKGILAIAVGFAMVMLFMVTYYRKAGVIAALSLGLNFLLIVALLSAFGATLTLPGLAGLALTIGMAVDSNVIIFERIRDELRIGATRDAAVHAGFNKALTAILDSNLTTLLSGLLLYYFGTGPIRGFAVSLSIGIVTTVYCAVFCTRLAFDTFALRKGERGLSI